MKTTLLAAVAALGLAAVTAAHANERDADEPFPFRAPGMTTYVAPGAYAVDTGSAAYPDFAGRPFQVVTAGGPDGVPNTGGESTVQTANSLPRGAMDGTVAYAQDRSVRRYLAQQAGAGPARTAQARRGRQGG